MKQNILNLLLFSGAALGIKSGIKDQLFASANVAAEQTTHSCAYAINRINSQAKIDWASLASQTTKWSDTSFPPSDALRWSDYTSGSCDGESSIKSWNRTYTSIPGAVLLAGGPMYDEINQGSLGDCYYLAGLSSVGEYATRLTNSFLTKTINAAGVFAVNVSIRGLPTTVVVDDYLPFTSWGTLVYDKPANNKAIWGPMMEKVWAKINGNYENIIGGNSFETFNLILNAPSVYISTTGSQIGYKAADSSTWSTAASKAWNIINSADGKQFVMGTGVGSSNPFGLVNGHAYSLIGAYQLKTNNVVTNQIYKIRNPWGVDVYNGKWNDSDKVSWTTSAISQAGFTNNTKDGDFFIEDKDFVKAFDSIIISYFNTNYVSSSVNIQNDNLAQYKYSFTTTKTQEVNVIVDFYPSRMYPRGCRSSYSYGYLTLQTSAGGIVQSNYFVYDTAVSNFINFPSLAAGSYLITFQMSKWDTNTVKDFTIRVYAPEYVTLTVPSATQLSSAVTGALTTTIQNGIGGANPYWQDNYGNFQFNYGFAGTTAYVELARVKACSNMKITAYLYYVDDSKAPPQASTGSCSLYDDGIYSCPCDLSSTGVASCKYAFYYDSYLSYGYGYSTITC